MYIMEVATSTAFTLPLSDSFRYNATNIHYAATGIGNATPLEAMAVTLNRTLSVTAGDDVTDVNDTFQNAYHLPHEQFFVVLNHLTVYLLPAEIILGCLGNMLAFYVLVTSNLIQQSCNVYLAFLTLVDTGFLLCALCIWIDFLTHSGVFSLNGFCQGIPYLTYVFSFLSGYTVVSFTVERFIVTFYPLYRKYMCTSRRAKIVVTSLSAFAFIFYSFPLYMSTVVKYEGYQECRPLVEFSNAAALLSSIDSIITLLLPSLVIIILNIAIAVRISRIFSTKSRHRLGQYTAVQLRERASSNQDDRFSTSEVSTARESGVNPHAQGHAQGHSQFQSRLVGRSRQSSVQSSRPLVHRDSASSLGSGRSQTRTTRTLIVLSTTFVVLKLPSHALRLHTFLHSLLSQPQLSHADTMWLVAWQELLQFIYYLNFAANFLLYCLVSSLFRQAAADKLKLALCCVSKWRRR
jgi:hypothetical protein